MIKVYLDSTIPNYVFNDHVPDKQKAVKALFKQIKANRFKAFVSGAVIRELVAAGENRQLKMLELIKGLKVLRVTPECEKLANKYIARKVLPIKNLNDARHIAIASIYKLDALISYNFEHIVKFKTINQVYKINKSLGYKFPYLIVPEEII